MDPEVEALKRLIGDSVARRTEVADRIGYNEQTLYQIANGIKLPSGKPRAVGRALKEALDQHYPGWNGGPPPDALQIYLMRDRDASEPMTNDDARIAARQDRPRVTVTPSLNASLARLGEALATVPPDRHEALAINLAGWARDGGRGPWPGLIESLLTASQKRLANGV